jgi:hypothetical protein
MAVTPAPYLKNLSALEAEANNITAFTPVSAGHLGFSTAFARCSTTTSATTGSASALPADPAGYILAVVGGNEVKIPFYNA